jgi:DNA-binding NarL/FixJ family response regulator
MERTMIRVLLVDGHQMFREGVCSCLANAPNICVVGQAGTASEAVVLIASTNPTVVVFDVRLPDAAGVDFARHVRSEWPTIKLVTLTGYDYTEYVRAMLRAGVDGYVLKSASHSSLVEALRDIVAGGLVLPPQIAAKAVRGSSSTLAVDMTREPDTLTMRELEVMELVHQGFRNGEIGERLTISSRTVEAHVSNIVAKMGVRNRTDAVRIAQEHQMI